MPPATTSTQPKALSIEDACRTLTISRPTLYKLIGEGRLRSITIGRRRVIPVSEVEALLAGDRRARPA